MAQCIVLELIADVSVLGEVDCTLIACLKGGLALVVIAVGLFFRIKRRRTVGTAAVADNSIVIYISVLVFRDIHRSHHIVSGQEALEIGVSLYPLEHIFQ